MGKSTAIMIGDERVCTKCNVPQSLDNFQKVTRNGKVYVHGRCRGCASKEALKYKWAGTEALRNQKLLIVEERKNVPCADCGQRFPTCAMDFDHVRGEKKMNIAQSVAQTWSMEIFLAELDKCEVVCACCHRIRTYRNGGSDHLARIRKGRVKAGMTVRS